MYENINQNDFFQIAESIQNFHYRGMPHALLYLYSENLGGHESFARLPNEAMVHLHQVKTR